jgi:predicted kinase
LGRGKVSSLLAADTGADAAVRARARADARKYYLLAEACTREPLAPPVLYAVTGVIASGKSTVARALGARIAAPVVDADRVRKQLAGVQPTTPLPDAPFEGHYTAQASAEVYAELLRRAQVVLGSKRSVVVEASFRERAQRSALAELARRQGVGFRLIECVVPKELSRERLHQRAQEPSVSDGRAEVLDAFLASYQPVTELAPELHLVLATDRPLADTMDELARRLELGPA